MCRRKQKDNPRGRPNKDSSGVTRAPSANLDPPSDAESDADSVESAVIDRKREAEIDTENEKTQNVLFEMFNTLIFYCSVALVLYYSVIIAFEKYFPLDMKGKAILVTGCDRGFGFELTLKCVKNGMAVFAGCLSHESFSVLREKCANYSGKVLPFLLDLSDRKSIAQAVRFVEDQLRPNQGLHAVVNNAGLIKVGFDDWITAADYEACAKVNTFGTIDVTEKFKHLVKKAKGRIIIMSSICGRLALPGFGPYNVSKFAMEGYADTIRLELHPWNVKVSIIEPGFHRTAITMPGYWLNLFGEAWNSAPEQIKKEYGGKTFMKKYNALLNMVLNSPLNSTDVQRVVDVYYAAITSIFPKERYPVGKSAKFFFIPLSLMPAFVQDSILRLFLLFLSAGMIESLEAADTPASSPRSILSVSPGQTSDRSAVTSSTSTAQVQK